MLRALIKPIEKLKSLLQCFGILRKHVGISCGRADADGLTGEYPECVLTVHARCHHCAATIREFLLESE